MPTGTEAYLNRFEARAKAEGWDARSVLGALAAEIESAISPDRAALDGAALERSGLDLADARPPAELCRPDLLGLAHQVLLGRDHRRRHGVFYTSTSVATHLVDASTHRWPVPTHPRVCDPSCGGGSFLLAAGRWLESLGLTRREIVEQLLWGIDLDPLAVAVTDASLRLWSAEQGTATSPNVVEADALLVGIAAWPDQPAPFDLVVGNPPFQNQMQSSTARDRDVAALLEGRFGAAARGYADSAALFLLLAVDLVTDGGRVALVMPESFLSARDARPTREALSTAGALVGLWLPRTKLFDAAVEVCVPVVERGALRRPVTRWRGGALELVGPDDASPDLITSETWAPLAASVLGVPELPVFGDAGPGRTIGSIASATAGFRDHFYGLVPFVRDAAGDDSASALPRLVTSGVIEPGRLSSAGRPIKFAGSRFTDPRVDVSDLESSNPELARWGRARLRPKVVVATQTRVLEAAVDEAGDWWPSVPVISVECDADACWRVAAVLNSPLASLWAYRRFTGSALSGDAIKIAARQVVEVPLPMDESAWDEGVRHLRRAERSTDAVAWNGALVDFGRSMCEAYGVGDEVLDWWVRRLPGARREPPDARREPGSP